MAHSTRRRCLALILLALLAHTPRPPDAAAQPADHTFPETGQTVSGAFWTYWQQHGGLPVQGYAISAPFRETSPLDGKPYLVQYFERAVFEAHPENNAPFDVLLSQLGTFRYQEKYPQGAPDQHPALGGLLFPQTGHTVGGAFLAYWQAHGGLAQFGYPLSDEFAETSDLDGRSYTVQYFERAIFEHHPENQPPYDVLLGQLGTFRLRQQYAAGAPTPEATLSPIPAPSPTTAPVAPTPPPAPTEAAGDWPMYGHDPARTNTNPDETQIDDGNVQQLAPLWQVDVGGSRVPTSSGPIMAGGRVYVGSSVPGGPNYFAFDAMTGAKLWSADLHYVHSDCDDVGIGGTAAVSGNVLVAPGGDDAYYGLDATTGALLWRYDLEDGPSGFAWESPLIANGRVYFGTSSHCDNPSVRGTIRAVDLQTGALITAQGFVPGGQRGAGVWNSPALSPDGQTLVVATGEDAGGYDGPYNRALVTLDPVSLALRQANRQGDLNVDDDWGSTPLIFADSRGRTLAGANHKNGSFYLYDLAHLDAGPIWSKATGTMTGMMSAVDPAASGTIYVAGSNGWIYPLDPETGAARHDPLVVGKTHGNMALANGLLFANTGATGVQVYDTHTGDHLATLLPAHAGPTYTGVIVAHGVVYWLSGTYLNAWGVPSR